MKRTLIAVVFCVGLMLSPALAQQTSDPATKEDVQQLFELMQSRKMFDGVMDAMAKQLPEMTTSTLKKQMPNATPEQLSQMEAFTKDLTNKMFRNMPFDELMGAMMPAYQHNFTHADMQYLIQFYSSPTGKKMIDKMPAIMTEYMQNATPIMQTWMEKEMAEVQKSAEAYAKAMKESEEKKAAPSAKPGAKAQLKN